MRFQKVFDLLKINQCRNRYIGEDEVRAVHLPNCPVELILLL